MKSKRNKNIKIMLLHGSMLMLVFMLGMIPGTFMKTRAATYSEELVCSDNVPQPGDLISSPIIFKPNDLDIHIKTGTCCDASNNIINDQSDFIALLPYKMQTILTDEDGALYKDSIAEGNLICYPCKPDGTRLNGWKVVSKTKKNGSWILMLEGADVPKTSVTSPPEPRKLKYTGEEQPLITAGSADENGTMQYAVTASADIAPTDWSTTIPVGKEYKTYYVWYKAKGRDSYGDSKRKYVISRICFPVTFKVVNGAWNDGTTADKTVPISRYSNEDLLLKLKENDIPDVGSKPADGYMEGSWDVKPSVNTVISEAKTYTYTYAKKEQAEVKEPPAARGLTYNGSAQELVTAGSVNGGTLYYALGTDMATAPTTGWIESIPTATNVGTYYVWYKVKGDKDHIDTAPACISVTIAESKKTENSDSPSEEATPDELQEDTSLRLNSGFLISWKGSKVRVKWGSAPKADTFEIYASYCGKNKCKKIATVHGSNSITISSLKGKKLDPKRSMKVYVVAYRKGVKIGRTLTGHIGGGKNSHTNVKKLKVARKTYTLQAGKTAKIKVKTIKQNDHKKLLGRGHCAKLRYASSNPKVATVNKKGKIKALKAGNCTVYIYAINGCSKRIKVVVR